MVNRASELGTFSAYDNAATNNNVLDGAQAIEVQLGKDLVQGQYMFVVNSKTRQLFMGEFFGQSRWVKGLEPGPGPGIADLGVTRFQFYAVSYASSAVFTINDMPPPDISGFISAPEPKRYILNRRLSGVTPVIDKLRQRRD